MKKNQYILKSILNECDKHLKRMNFAYKKFFPLSPIIKERISKLNEDDISYIDQIIYRFSKLQDAIGQKLFKAVLIFLDEDVINKSSIDIFNRLEQLEIIENYEIWKDLRDLRNELAHEYEENENETAEKLNTLFEKKSDLEKYLNDIRNYLSKREFEF
ncbi:MAG: hypothetical protein KJ799_02155 [Bacteroidetes bacterium]|nr:hypothetical protein [Bacteroidota bacterium]MBU2505513.1 hypothetical protein [Bacteroidota bacterium]